MSLRIPIYFSVEEMVCPHVFSKFQGNERMIWNFFDPRLLITLDKIREMLGSPITVNNWKDGGSFTQRGLRCNICPLVKEKTAKNSVYVSSHILGQAADFDVKGMSAAEVRSWLYEHKNLLPYPISVEKDVNWVHLDMRCLGKDNFYLF